ncbi:hypothetical protein [Clostridium tertium]|uniref:hypothetical protein n=1 Tax=Clostridium tertium TaxID=1559 RepID=UPI0022DFAB27|nr:hypothetical protein [Clostridium tertium]
MIIITNEKQREAIVTREKMEKSLIRIILTCIILSVTLIINSIFIRASLALFLALFCIGTIILRKIVADEFLTESEIILKEDLLIE